MSSLMVKYLQISAQIPKFDSPLLHFILNLSCHFFFSNQNIELLQKVQLKNSDIKQN